jgi:5-methylcytosine-specific restriction endonuclease McrA
MSVLALDISGTPRQWISNEDAITYHAKDAVAWSMGDVVVRFRGGLQNDGTESYLESPSIIAIRGHGFNPFKHATVALSNRTLFGRDRHVCAYCGGHFPNYNVLSRDHIVPKSRGGENTWMNCVTACKECNSNKGHKTLKEAGLELLYVPYVPNHFENMILQNRSILADQMEYLLSGVPKHSRVLKDFQH